MTRLEDAYIRQRNKAVAVMVLHLVVRFWYIAIPLFALLICPTWLGALITVVAFVAKSVIWRFQKLQDAAIRNTFGDPTAYTIFRKIASSWNQTMIRHGLASRHLYLDGIGLRRAFAKVAITRGMESYLREVANGIAPADYDVPDLIDGRPTLLGLDLRVRLLPNQTAQSFESRKDSLTTEWAQATARFVDKGQSPVRVKSVQIEVGPNGLGEIIVKVVYLDPLSTGRNFTVPCSVHAQIGTPIVDSSCGFGVSCSTLGTVSTIPVDAVEVGVREDGRDWRFRLDQTSSVIGGVPGSGKSVLLNRILAGVAINPRIQIVGIDCKGGVELWDWKPRLSAIAEDQASASQILKKIDQIGARRLQELKGSGSKSLSRSGYSPEVPLIVLIIDEAAELFISEGSDREDRARASALTTMVSRIVRLYRAAGIIVITATQKPTVDSLPSIIRDNSPQKVAFRCTTAEQSVAILGDGIRSSDVLPTRVTDNQRGYAVISDKDGGYSLARGDFISEEAVRYMAGYTAHLAVPLDDLAHSTSGGLHALMVAS